MVNVHAKMGSLEKNAMHVPRVLGVLRGIVKDALKTILTSTMILNVKVIEFNVNRYVY